MEEQLQIIWNAHFLIFSNRTHTHTRKKTSVWIFFLRIQTAFSFVSFAYSMCTVPHKIWGGNCIRVNFICDIFFGFQGIEFIDSSVFSSSIYGIDLREEHLNFQRFNSSHCYSNHLYNHSSCILHFIWQRNLCMCMCGGAGLLKWVCFWINGFNVSIHFYGFP